MAKDGLDLREKIARHVGDLQPQQVFHLRQRNQHRNPVGEANDDAYRHVAHQRTQLEQAQRKQQYARASGGNQQIGHTVAFDDAVDDDDKGPCRAADLCRSAPQRRDDEPRDDGRPQPRFGLEPAGNRKCHGQRQGHDTYRQPGTYILAQSFPAVAP